MKIELSKEIEQGNKDCIVLDMSCVKTIADMQRDLDAYHFAFYNIIGMLKGRFSGTSTPAVGCGIAASREVNEEIEIIFSSAKILREEFERLREEYQAQSCDYGREG